MADTYKHTVVIDHGNGICKGGIAGRNEPEVKVEVIATRDVNVGHQQNSNQDLMIPQITTEHDLLIDWKEIQVRWNHVFKELSVDPRQCKVILIDAAHIRQDNRPKMMELLFEQFGVHSVAFITDAEASMFATNLQTGIVLDSGEHTTRAVPFVDGKIVKENIGIAHVAGAILTDYMSNLLKSMNILKMADRKTARDIAEKVCYVATDFVDEQKISDSSKSLDVTHTLLNGEEIIIAGQARYQCPEALFQPGLMGIVGKSIPQAVYDCIMKFDVDIREKLCANIILSGGNTMYPGILDRMEKELKTLTKRTITIIAPANRQYLAWIDASQMNLPTYYRPT